MVSFFGLKFGGDKKKKEHEIKAAPTQQKKLDQNNLGEGQFFGRNTRGKGPAAGGSSIRSAARPGTSHGGGGRSPYALQTHNLAANSMYDLAQTNGPSRRGSFASIKPFASDANLRTRFANGSSASLAPPPSLGFGGGSGGSSGSRPGTSHSTRSAKGWVNPLDVHFGRPATPSAGPPGSPAFSVGGGGPRSPLGQFELPLTPGAGGDADGSSLFGDQPEKVAQEIGEKVAQAQEEAKARAEAEARARAQAELEEQARRNAEATASPTQRSFPSSPLSSPPATATVAPPLPSPRFQGQGATEGRPSSRGSDRRAGPPGGGGRPAKPGFRPRDPREREHRVVTPVAAGNKHHHHHHHAGPHGLPSPPLSNGTRSSEEQSIPGSSSSSSGSTNASGRPVIQNVRAKRDTLTLNPPRRRGLSIKIEELEQSLVSAQEAHREQQQQQQQQQRQRRDGEQEKEQARQREQQQQHARMVSASSSYYGDDAAAAEEPAQEVQPPLPLSPLSPKEQSFFPPFAQAPRPQSPSGRGRPGADRPRRPAPEEYGVLVQRPQQRTESPMGRVPPPRAPGHVVRNHSPMGRGPMQGAAARPQRPESPMGRPPRPQSPAGHGSRNHSPAGRGARPPRTESPMGRQQRRPESPAGYGARTQNPKERGPMNGAAARPQRSDSPLGRPPRPQSPAGYGSRNQSPLGRPPRPQSPMGHGARNQSPAGRRGPHAPRPQSPMARSGPRNQSPAPARGGNTRRPAPTDESFPRHAASPPNPASNDSNSSGSSNNTSNNNNDSAAHAGGGLVFRQPNWGAAPQTSAPPTPTVPAEPSASANWPLPASPVTLEAPSSPPPGSPLPAVPRHHQKRVPPPLNIAAARAGTRAAAPAPVQGPWTPQLRQGTPPEEGEEESRRPQTAGVNGTPGLARGLSVKDEEGWADSSNRGRGRERREWRGDERTMRPNFGLKSPTGIADEHGTGFI